MGNQYHHHFPSQGIWTFLKLKMTKVAVFLTVLSSAAAAVIPPTRDRILEPLVKVLEPMLILEHPINNKIGEDGVVLLGRHHGVGQTSNLRNQLNKWTPT